MDKRETILEAAKFCFSKYGYAKTNLEDIGKRSGLNKASLYYYFENKEAVYETVLLSESEALIHSLEERFEKEKPAEGIVSYIADRGKDLSSAPSLCAEITSTDIHRPMRFLSIQSKHFQRESNILANLINKGIENQSFQEVNVKMVAESLITLSNAFLKEEEFFTEEKVETLVRFILNGISV